MRSEKFVTWHIRADVRHTLSRIMTGVAKYVVTNYKIISINE